LPIRRSTKKANREETLWRHLSPSFLRIHTIGN
jgi:hypothetical protein